MCSTPFMIVAVLTLQLLSASHAVLVREALSYVKTLNKSMKPACCVLLTAQTDAAAGHLGMTGPGRWSSFCPC